LGHLPFAQAPLLSGPISTLAFCPGFTYLGAFRAFGASNPESESDKASFMSGFKEPNFADRQKAAMQARQDILNKFRAKPGLDDPEVQRRQAEREAQAAARAKAREAKETAKAEQKRLEAEAAARKRPDRARKGRRSRQAGALEAEQKAKRDARYAARKGKGKKK
jgi:hypothetical protein